MKVFRIGNSEVSIIEEALSHKEDLYKKLLKEDLSEGPKRDIERELAHVLTIGTLMRDQRLQELCERCLSYFWDRLSAEGVCNPDVEWLSEEMVVTENELVELFREAGFEEE